MVRIELIGDLTGSLDIEEGTSIPITFRVGDIRDVFSRGGTFSKTIKLAGTKNNNILLNSYFDVNVRDLKFNVNRVHNCNLIQGNDIIISNGIFRLLKVIKSSNVDTLDELVEYEVQVIDRVGDFFKNIKDKSMSDLISFRGYEEVLNSQNVISRWHNNNVWQDIWTYPLNLDNAGTRNIDVGRLHPAIYARQYFEAIHNEGGIEFEWDEIDSNRTLFSKAVVPFNGSLQPIIEQINQREETIVRSTQEQTLTFNPIERGFKEDTVKLITFNVAEKDLLQRFTLGNAPKYKVPYKLEGTTQLEYTLEMDYEFSVFFGGLPTQGSTLYRIDKFIEGRKVETKPVIRFFRGDWTNENNLSSISQIKHTTRLNNLNQPERNTIRLNNAGTFEFYRGDENPNLSYIDIANYQTENTALKLFSGVVRTTGTVTGFDEGDDIVPALWVQVLEHRSSDVDNEVLFRRDTNNIQPFINYKATIRSARLTIRLRDNESLPVGSHLRISEFINKEIKQSEFLKGIYNMYNLYYLQDNITGKIKYLSRDDFYNSGKVKDWTKKLIRDRNTEIYFLPEVLEREVILKYTDDNTEAQKQYLWAYGESFASKRIVFDNKNATGKKDMVNVFAPTLGHINEDDIFILDYKQDSPLRIVIKNTDRELDIEGNYLIVDDVEVNNQPIFSMFDDYLKPKMSLEFGESKNYGYRLKTLPRNNLYNTFWENTFKQINTGRLLVAYFWLTPNDIANLRMNDIIIVDNKKYFINQIKDYDAGKEQPTKVELMSVEEGFEGSNELIYPYL